MSNANFPSARIFNYQYDPVMVCGSFEINAGAIANIHGDAFTVAYTAAGNYLVTMRDRYRHIISATCQLRFESGTPNVDLVARVGATVVGAAAANTVQICATDTDLVAPGPILADPANGNRLDFIVIYSNKSLDT